MRTFAAADGLMMTLIAVILGAAAAAAATTVAVAAEETANNNNNNIDNNNNNNNDNSNITIPLAAARFPLVAQSGTHHVHVYVGQPPVRQTLIVDTGSRFTAWICHPCRNCGKHSTTRRDNTNNYYYDYYLRKTTNKRQQQQQLQESDMAATPYDPQRSSTMRRLPNACRHNHMDASQCHFTGLSTCGGSSSGSSSNSNNHLDHDACVLEQRYTEGSTWSAIEIQDYVSLAVTTTTPMEEQDQQLQQQQQHANANTTTTTTTTTTSYEHSLPYTIPFVFGCQTTLTGLFREQYADGILGMEHSEFSLMEALDHHGVFGGEYNNNNSNKNNNKNHKNDDDNVQQQQGESAIPTTTTPRSFGTFSLCLSRTGGWMNLGHGGAMIDRHLSQMRITPLAVWQQQQQQNNDNKKNSSSSSSNNNNNDKQRNMYTISVEQFWLGDTCLTCRHDDRSPKTSENTKDDNHNNNNNNDLLIQAFANGRGTILDSGTTDTYLPAAIAPVFQKAWKEQTHRDLETTRTSKYTQVEFETLPVVRMVLTNNVTWTISPRNYMEGARAGEAIWKRTTTTSNSNNSSSSISSSSTNTQQEQQPQVELTNRLYVDEPKGAVIGINFMLDHDIFYDWHGKRIGIAPADCG